MSFLGLYIPETFYLSAGNAGEIIMYILQSGLIGPSKRYLRIIIYMDA